MTPKALAIIPTIDYVERRVSPKLKRVGECWVWQGAKTSNMPGIGYGRAGITDPTTKKTRAWLVHRAVYEAFNGPIPAGGYIDHLCRNRLCINIGHMEVVSFGENVLRGVSPAAENAQKTHCPRGHEYTPENTYNNPSGFRVCRLCAKRYLHEYYEDHK